MSNPSGRRTIIRNQINSSDSAQRSTAARKQQIKPRKPRKQKLRLKRLAVAGYIAAFAFIAGMIALGYESPVENNQIAGANAAVSGVVPVNPTGDELTDASIAGRIAEIVDIPVADKVIEHSIALEVQGLVAAFNSSGDATGDKPQLITSVDDERLLTQHTVREGETVEHIANKYGVSEDTIKFANNLTRNTLSVGTKLKILPVSGVLYKVKSGDTLASLASKYKVTEQRIVLFNDLELSGLEVGEEIILPNAELPVTERPGYVRPSLYQGYSYRYGGDYHGSNIRALGQAEAISKYLPHVSSYYQRSNGPFGSNTMTLGQCTWYVWERRLALSRQGVAKALPTGMLGNAGSWSPGRLGTSAVGDIHKNLSRGAIMQRFGHPGHVSVVENVVRDDNGRIVEILVSEMNHIRTQYFGAGNMRATVSERTYSGSVLGSYRFLY